MINKKNHKKIQYWDFDFNNMDSDNFL